MNQLALALPGIGGATFDNFDAAPGAVAKLRLQALAQSPAEHMVLVLGPSGCGKTHLLLATAEAARDAGHRVAYGSLSNALANEWLQAASGDLVIVDDVDRADRKTAEALFALINRQHDRRRALLASAAALPDPPPLPDLQSRLLRAEQLVLPGVDDDARRQILAHRAAQAGIPIEPAALDYLLRRAPRDLAGLMRLLDTLHQRSLEDQRRITVPWLRAVLQ